MTIFGSIKRFERLKKQKIKKKQPFRSKKLQALKDEFRGEVKYDDRGITRAGNKRLKYTLYTWIIVKLKVYSGILNTPEGQEILGVTLDEAAIMGFTLVSRKTADLLLTYTLQLRNRSSVVGNLKNVTDKAEEFVGDNLKIARGFCKKSEQLLEEAHRGCDIIREESKLSIRASPTQLRRQWNENGV